MKPLKAVIFDWDGTLLDSSSHIANTLMQAAESSGLSLSYTEAREVVGQHPKEFVSRLFPDATAAMQQKFIETCWYYYTQSKQRASLFEGSVAMLQQLQANGLRLAVATGNSRAGLDLSMDYTQSAHFFDVTRCADETRAKPHPLMIEEILTDLFLTKEEVILVGDTSYDMQLAEQAGIACIAVTYGAHTIDELSSYQTVAMACSIYELERCIIKYASMI